MGAGEVWCDLLEGTKTASGPVDREDVRSDKKYIEV
jgi:hypothetical protein